MIKKASSFDIFWGYAAQFLNVGSGIIIIPVAIKFLTSDDMGLWFLFLAIAGAAQLLEFGLQPTVSRMTSYVYSGAIHLKSEGLPDQCGTLDPQVLFDLVYATKNIYRYISFFVAFILVFLGTFYLSTFNSFGRYQLISWLIYSLSVVINFNFTYMNGLIIGRGSQKDLYISMTISKLTLLVVTIPLLFFNFGLLSMAIGMFFSTISLRILLYYLFYTEDQKRILKNVGILRFNYTKTLWLSAWKLGLTSLGTFLILRANIFIVSSYMGLKVAANYGLTVQVISILSSVSCMIFNLNLPRLNSLQSLGDLDTIRSVFKKTLLISHFLYLLGALFLVVLGAPILSLISTNTHLLSSSILIFMLITYQLELNHSICGSYLTTLNKVPFLNSALLSGFFILFFSILIANYTDYGVTGLVLSQFFVQIIFNNWYWPLVVYKELR